MAAPTLAKPVFEHHHSGFGVGHTKPRLSWQFLGDEKTAPGWVQTAYDVEISSAGGAEPVVHHIEGSSQSVLVPWPAGALTSRQSATVRVRSYGKSEDSTAAAAAGQTEWSPPATVEVGLLYRADWIAEFVAAGEQIGNSEGPIQPRRFHKEFTLPSGAVASKARLYITALGVFDVYVNGEPASDECMAPGWQSYHHRLAYSVLDVGRLLKTDGQPNAICVEVAEGWYAGRIGFEGGKTHIYGSELAVLAQLEVSFEGKDDGHYKVTTDDSWLCSPSSIQTSELYDGEVRDMRTEMPEWKVAVLKGDKSSSRFKPTKTVAWPKGRLVLPEGPPVRVTQEISPVDIFRSKSGKVIIDFGQNMVGKLLVRRIHLPAGEAVSFRHAEVMEHGELGTRPLRKAKCEDTVISAGSPVLDWSPRFTYHGFRYVEVNDARLSSDVNAPLPDKSNFIGLVMHSDMKRRGFFKCSNKSVNRLHENILWSTRGNFFSIPTDCPQRDERLGWTGDLQVFCPSASFLFDTVGMLGGWLEDVAAEQLEDGKGGIPGVICPDYGPANWPHMPAAVWDDVTVLTPDALHRYSGDVALLQRQLPSMLAWLDQGVDRGADGLWNEELWQLGDWLDPTAPPNAPFEARTDAVLVADAYLVRVTETLARVCATINRDDLASKYTTDAARLKAAFQNKYLTPHGNLMSNSQTGLALAVEHGLYSSPAQVGVAATALSRLVRKACFRIATGFAGTPIIAHALTRTAQPQLAYRMLVETSCPSWLYPITMGATTVWERWDSMLPDGTINPGEMTSFNHYALGAVADWLHGTVAGIGPMEAGWKVVRVRPVPGGNLTSAEARFDGPYGVVSVEWKMSGDRSEFEMALVVPPNSTAVVTLPSELKKGPEEREEDEPRRTVGSGRYVFKCRYEAGEWPPKESVPMGLPVPGDESIAV